MHVSKRKRRRPPRPIWSIGSITGLTVGTLLIVSLIVFLVGKRNILADAELVCAIVAASLFLFLSIGLYRGVRVRKQEAAPQVEFSVIEPSDIGLQGLDSFGSPFDGADDLPGAILGLLFWLLLPVILIVIFPLILSGVVFVFLLLVVACFWIFRRGLRQVFARSPSCRGRLGKSLGYAAFYTFLYAGWLFVVLGLVEYFHPGAVG